MCTHLPSFKCMGSGLLDVSPTDGGRRFALARGALSPRTEKRLWLASAAIFNTENNPNAYTILPINMVAKDEGMKHVEVDIPLILDRY